MKKVKDAVTSILFNAEAATEAFFKGYLNFSAYAKHIQAEVKKETKKEVTTGSIVVALSRLNRQEKGRLRKAKHEFIPDIQFNDISVRSSLIELTFDNSLEARKKIGSQNFYYIAIGVNEITMITNTDNKTNIIENMLPLKPKIILSGLASVTVRFDSAYMAVPNTVYAILRSLALNFINVIEVVSTYTELSFIVEQKEMIKTFEILNRYLRV